MNIYLRHVKPYGFKGSSMFSDSKWSHMYYHKDTVNRRITVVSNQTPQYVAQYQLTEKEMRAFNRGTLGITPPGCCNASGGKTIEEAPQTIVQRDIKNMADLESILIALGIIPFDQLVLVRKSVKHSKPTDKPKRARVIHSAFA